MHKRAEEECEWIDNNLHRYKDKQHADNVKHNIRMLYQIRDLEGRARRLKSSLRY